MTPYTLDWDDEAHEALAAAYVVAFDQAAVTRAEYAAELLLSVDPLRHAVALPEGLFKLTIEPIVIYFWVEEAVRVVRISGAQVIP
jgi:hypothetical protein